MLMNTFICSSVEIVVLEIAFLLYYESKATLTNMV